MEIKTRIVMARGAFNNTRFVFQKLESRNEKIVVKYRDWSGIQMDYKTKRKR